MRRGTGIVPVIAAVAALTLAACTGGAGEGEATAPSTSAADTTAASETTTPDGESATQAAGLAAIEQYYADLDSVAQNGYANEAAITALLDSVGPNFRLNVDATIEDAQAHGWGQNGATSVEEIGVQSYEVTEDYALMVLRVCRDTTAITYLTNGEPNGSEGSRTTRDVTIFVPTGSDTAQVDGQTTPLGDC